MEVGQGILFSRKYLQSVGGGGGKGAAVPRWHSARCVYVQSPQPLRSFRVTNELDVGVNGLRGWALRPGFAASKCWSQDSNPDLQVSKSAPLCTSPRDHAPKFRFLWGQRQIWLAEFLLASAAMCHETDLSLTLPTGPRAPEERCPGWFVSWDMWWHPFPQGCEHWISWIHSAYVKLSNSPIRNILSQQNM